MRSRGDLQEYPCSSRPQPFRRDNNLRTGFRGNKVATRGFKPRKYEGDFPEKKVESKFVEDEWTKTQVQPVESLKRGGKRKRNDKRGRRHK